MAQEKLMRYWQTIGFRVLVRETSDHPTFCAYFMGDGPLSYPMIVPHLYPSTVVEAAIRAQQKAIAFAEREHLPLKILT
jgi:hypothetical protein